MQAKEQRVVREVHQLGVERSSKEPVPVRVRLRAIVVGQYSRGIDQQCSRVRWVNRLIEVEEEAVVTGNRLPPVRSEQEFQRSVGASRRWEFRRRGGPLLEKRIDH